MTDDPTQALRALLLPGFGVLRIAGPDAVTFLQGQLTNDVRLLVDGRTQLTACCTPQGRVLAMLRLRQIDEAIYALLPADVLPQLATHLRKFVLRAKVEIMQAADLHVGAIVADDAASATQTQRALDEAALTMSPVPLSGTTEVVAFQYSPDREVLAAPAGAWRSISGLSLSRPSARAQAEWLASDIARGLPQVVAATSAQFTPQMLNVDLLDGVSYSKGCYTGQEIVARTHHLGRVKRRTMRYRLAAGGEPPALLSSLQLDGVRVGDVLMAAATADGIELLAVTNLDAAGKTLLTEDGRSAELLPLPYPLD